MTRAIKQKYIALLRDGLSNAEIAEATGVKKSTVASYRSILVKRGDIKPRRRAKDVITDYDGMIIAGEPDDEILRLSGVSCKTLYDRKAELRRQGLFDFPTREKATKTREKSKKAELNQRVLRDGSLTLEKAAVILGVSPATVGSLRAGLHAEGVFVSSRSRLQYGRFFQADNFLTLHMCPECEANLVRDGYANGVQRFFCPECGKKLSATAVLDDIAAQMGFDDWRALSVAIAHGECAVCVRLEALTDD